jgi:HPt (histidine-containing phosphotransfer) domain-containing protein
MPPPDLLDLTTIRNLLELDDGSTGLLAEMTALFRDDTPQRIQDLAAAAARGDAGTFSRVAHALKGGAGALGATGMRGAAAELEALGHEGSVDASPDLRDRLDELFRRSLAALEAVIQEGRL